MPEVSTTDDTNPKDLIGITKVDLSLVPPSASIEEARAFSDGAVKYGPYNWRDKKVRAMIYIAAAKRHIDAYVDGESHSQDTRYIRTYETGDVFRVLRNRVVDGVLHYVVHEEDGGEVRIAFDECETVQEPVHHLGHARACLGIILDAEATGNLVDDRPSPGVASALLDRYQRSR